ncbi:hypothetical protein KAU33_12380 [Candidatus Dependentiae bacterium]|nr:hypothetical protein [Candidatus Dependentiae bacterium]
MKIKKNLLAKIIFAISIPIVLFFILEYTFAFFGVKTMEKALVIEDDWRLHHMYNDGHFTEDENLLWRGNPNSPAFNSYGFHTREFPEEKKKGKLRIFCIGDSNTLGNLKYSYPELLEESLNKNKSRHEYEVYNLGIYGYSSTQGLILLKQVIKHHPDIVIINFGWNDAVPVKSYTDSEIIKKTSKINIVMKRFLLNSRTYHYFYSIIRKKSNLKKIPRVSKTEFEANYNEMIKICSEERIKIILLTRAINPHAIIPEDNWRFNVLAYNDIVVQIGKEKEISVIRANQHIKDKDDFIDESHYSLSGYKSLIGLIKEVIIPNINK